MASAQQGSRGSHGSRGSYGSRGSRDTRQFPSRQTGSKYTQQRQRPAHSQTRTNDPQTVTKKFIKNLIKSLSNCDFDSVFEQTIKHLKSLSLYWSETQNDAHNAEHARLYDLFHTKKMGMKRYQESLEQQKNTKNQFVDKSQIMNIIACCAASNLDIRLFDQTVLALKVGGVDSVHSLSKSAYTPLHLVAFPSQEISDLPESDPRRQEVIQKIIKMATLLLERKYSPFALNSKGEMACAAIFDNKQFHQNEQLQIAMAMLSFDTGCDELIRNLIGKLNKITSAPQKMILQLIEIILAMIVSPEKSIDAFVSFVQTMIVKTPIIRSQSADDCVKIIDLIVQNGMGVFDLAKEAHKNQKQSLEFEFATAKTHLSSLLKEQNPQLENEIKTARSRESELGKKIKAMELRGNNFLVLRSCLERFCETHQVDPTKCLQQFIPNFITALQGLHQTCEQKLPDLDRRYNEQEQLSRIGEKNTLCDTQDELTRTTQTMRNIAVTLGELARARPCVNVSKSANAQQTITYFQLRNYIEKMVGTEKMAGSLPKTSNQDLKPMLVMHALSQAGESHITPWQKWVIELPESKDEKTKKLRKLIAVTIEKTILMINDFRWSKDVKPKIHANCVAVLKLCKQAESISATETEHVPELTLTSESTTESTGSCVDIETEVDMMSRKLSSMLCSRSKIQQLDPIDPTIIDDFTYAISTDLLKTDPKNFPPMLKGLVFAYCEQTNPVVRVLVRATLEQLQCYEGIEYFNPKIYKETLQGAKAILDDIECDCQHAREYFTELQTMFDQKENEQQEVQEEAH